MKIPLGRLCDFTIHNFQFRNRLSSTHCMGRELTAAYCASVSPLGYRTAGCCIKSLRDGNPLLSSHISKSFATAANMVPVAPICSLPFSLRDTAGPTMSKCAQGFPLVNSSRKHAATLAPAFLSGM